MAELAGRIAAELDWQQGQIVGLNLNSSRPAQLGRLFYGRRVDEVARMLPLLFSACTVGQRLAFARAVEQCRGIVISDDVAVARQVLLQLENGRELLFRLVQHWLPSTPKQLQLLQPLQRLISTMEQRWGFLLTPVAPTLSGATHRLDREALKRDQQDVVRQLRQILEPLLGMPLECLASWLQQAAPTTIAVGILLQPLTSLQQRFAGLCLGPDLAELPDLQQRQQRQILGSKDAKLQQTLFCATPRWQEHCCETGSYVRYRTELQGMRQQGWHELCCRYGAILLQLSDIPKRLLATESIQMVSSNIAAEVGLAVVDTARGQLLHRLVLDAEQIRCYDIVAPTEWNLHPQGLVPSKLQGVATATVSEALALSRTMLLLADPCVEFDLKLKTEDAI
ncbi:hypothetical protein [Amphritea sp.]|uniref:hypothetical protein n=1 Tax=Amphritea sp. TaxID=1872502 RepID=UPI003A9180DB